MRANLIIHIYIYIYIIWTYHIKRARKRTHAHIQLYIYIYVHCITIRVCMVRANRVVHALRSVRMYGDMLVSTAASHTPCVI